MDAHLWIDYRPPDCLLKWVTYAVCEFYLDKAVKESGSTQYHLSWNSCLILVSKSYSYIRIRAERPWSALSVSLHRTLVSNLPEFYTFGQNRNEDFLKVILWWNIYSKFLRNKQGSLQCYSSTQAPAGGTGEYQEPVKGQDGPCPVQWSSAALLGLHFPSTSWKEDLEGRKTRALPRPSHTAQVGWFSLGLT